MVIPNTLFQQHKRWLYTWISSDGQYGNQTDYIFCRPKVEKFYTINKKRRPGADCGSDQELLMVKFRFKLRKIRKTSRWFKYDLNQVLYDGGSWTIKKAECRRTDGFKLWYWRILLRVPWTARRSSQSILRKSTLNIHWEDWCWSWNSNTLAT